MASRSLPVTATEPAPAARGGARKPQPALRRPVAVLVSRFPLITETFVLREIIELERQGQPVVLVPLLRERPAVVHPEARPWVARALYTPFLSPAIAAANARALRRRPAAYLRLLGALVRGTAASPGLLARTLALFPKSVYLSERLQAAGVGHVHAHFVTHPGTAAFVIHRLTGIPCSLTAHAHDIFVRRDLLGPKIAAARFVRCVSAFNRDFLGERYPAQADKLKVVHVGVDVRPRDEAPAPAAAASPPRLLCVAALKPYKGHAVLVEALKRLRADGLEFACDLVGDGPLRDEVAAAVAGAGLSDRVRLLGARTQAEVAALLASSSALVQPSVVARDGQMEGIPVALMEAMAARKPVVAAALSGIPELVEDGVSGLLVPPGDPVALAGALARVLREPALGAWLGEQGRRKVVREFDLTATTGELLAALDAHRLPPPEPWAERLREGAFTWPAAGLRRIHERPDSSVAEILLPSSAADGVPREVVLKTHRAGDGAPSPDAARREFDTLADLQYRMARLGAERFGTPHPLGLEEERGTVLMTACPGEPLSERVRRLRWARAGDHAAGLRHLERAGAWLRAFQECTRDDGGRSLVEPMVRRAEEDAAVAGLPRRLRERVRRRLRDLAQIDGGTAGDVGRHGDLWPGNVFVSEEGVQVVDFEGFARGLPYEDAAYFLVQLGLFYSYPGLARRRRAARAAFLEGYLAGAPLDRAAWALCWTAKVLHVLARTGSGPRGGALRERWRRHALLAMLGAEP